MRTVVVGRIVRLVEHEHIVVLQVRANGEGRRPLSESPTDPASTCDVHVPADLWPAVLEAARSPRGMLITVGQATHDGLFRVRALDAVKVTAIVPRHAHMPPVWRPFRRHFVNATSTTPAPLQPQTRARLFVR